MRWFRLAVVVLSLSFSLHTARAAGQTTRSLPDQPSSVDPEDFVMAKGLTAQVAAMLAHGDYDAIDRLATKYRSEKTRLPGGGWELAYLYEGLAAPDRAHPEDHIAELNAWIAARPQSITPRVALAGVYLKYAWVARGAGYADSVTPEGWKLFDERAAKAKQVLDDAANITPMCPEWYEKMQTVALAQNWDKDRAEALFQKAIQFEPDYLYFYKSHANYLLPKWDGDEGDAAAFAKRSADAIGGAKGDYIYFQIGMVVADAKSGANGGGLDWARIQRGYRAQRELFGRNMNGDVNHLAFFAWRFQDRAVARQALAQIGDKWSKNVWKTRKRFEQVRTWAMQSDPV